MKKLFHKAITVLGSLVLVGATMSGAFAASFSDLSGSNTSVVVGSTAMSSDATAAAKVVADLGTTTSGSVTFTGGDSYQLEKSYDKFNLGESIDDFGTLYEDDMPDFLKDGVYKDKDNTEVDYTQSITFGTDKVRLDLFSEKKYNNREITIGFNIADGNEILTYNVDFDGTLMNADGADIPLLGNMYYVSSVNNGTTDTIELFDSSSSVELEEGASETVSIGTDSYEVTVSYITATQARFVVNGKSLGNIAVGSSQKLSDGSYILLKDTYVSSKESILSTAEFTIGSGLITLENGAEVEIADEDVDGLVATVDVNAGTISLKWNADGQTFLTEEDNELTMPGFNSIKVVYGGLTFSELEETEFVPGDEFVLSTEVKDGSLDLPLVYYNGSNMSLGSSDNTPLKFTSGVSAKLNETDEDKLVVVSSRKTTGEEYATVAYEIKSVTEDGSKIEEVVLTNLANGNELKLESNKEAVKGNVKYKLETNGSLSILPVSASFQVDFEQVYTVNGLTIYFGDLDLNSSDTSKFTVGNDTLTVFEPTYEGKISNTNPLTLKLAINTDDDELHVLSVSGEDVKKSDDDVTTAYIYSEMATKYEFDESDDSHRLVVYTGEEEATAEVVVTSGSVEVSSGSTGAKAYEDDETTSFAGKNLIVVGGSCVNAVAAELLGGNYCGAEFTTRTGVGAGQFMIQSFAKDGKVALLVAGYEADDTTRAVNYLLANPSISTTVGSKNVYETATSTVVTQA